MSARGGSKNLAGYQALIGLVTEQEQRINTIFQRALEREGVERRAFLDGACDGDDELRREVELRIEKHRGDGRSQGAQGVRGFDSAEDVGNTDLKISDLREGDRGNSDLKISELGEGGLGNADLRMSGSQIAGSQISDRKISDRKISGSQVSGSQISGSQISDHKISDRKISGSQISDHKISDLREEDLRISGSQISDFEEPGLEGRTIGPYKIISLLGAGGMGEVYRAHDARLGRTVALKLLPPTLSRGEESVRRFQQEARAASALNHPNILAIYDIGTTDDGLPYVVSELLEGETLREKLAAGPLPLRKAIDGALQTARGLTAAHSKGIVHRDLKPENLFVTKDARLKILDFGIAKLTSQKNDGDEVETEAPTRMIDTEPGMVIGTAGYMSPEQVRGGRIDTRSDIFSLGAILYEMLAGKRAFHCDTRIETMNAILKHDPPDLSTANNQISPALDRVVRRCLEKEPDERFQTASDLAFALDSLTSVQSAGAATIVEHRKATWNAHDRWRDWLGWGVAAILLVGLLVLAGFYFRRADPPAETMRFLLEVPDKTTLTESIALSPDGRHIAFVVTAESGGTSLWVRSLDSVKSRELAGTEGAHFPFWSPDSRFIAFFGGNKLKRVDMNGGPVQVLADTSAESRGGSWSANDTILFSPGFTMPLSKIAAGGGPVEPATKLDEARGVHSHRWPHFLPDGKSFLFFQRSSDRSLEGIYAGSLDSADYKLILKTNLRAAYAPPPQGRGAGHLMFMRDRALLAQPFDIAKLQLMGEPVVVAEELLAFPGEGGPTGFASFSVSANGHVTYLSGEGSDDQMQWFDRKGNALELFGPPGKYYEPGLSPDGKRIVVGRGDTDPGDIWIFDVARATPTRLTFDSAADVSPVWSPDGSRIAFASVRKGKFGIYQKAASGAGEDELLLQTELNAFPTSWSPDGRYILYETEDLNNLFDLYLLPLAPGEKPFPYLKTKFNETHSQFSPDGRWVAYASDESGRSEIYIQSFPATGGKWQISHGGGDQPQWRGDGKELFYLASDRRIMAVSLKVGETVEAATPVPLFLTRVKPTAQTDDKNVYFALPDGQKFLVKNLLLDGDGRPLTVVLNWAAKK